MHQKIADEKIHFDQEYAYSQNFVNLYTFSFPVLGVLSDWLSTFFATVINDNDLQQLWHTDGTLSAAGLTLQEGECNQLVQSVGGKIMRMRYMFGAQCRTVTLLEPFFRAIRSNWYAALGMLLDAQQKHGRMVLKDKPGYQVVPYTIKQLDNGYWCAVQPAFHEYTTQTIPDELSNAALMQKSLPGIEMMIKRYNLECNNVSWAFFNNHLCYYNWQACQTSSDPYAFGYPDDYIKGKVKPLSTFYQELHEKASWRTLHANRVRQAQKNEEKIRKTKDQEREGKQMQSTHERIKDRIPIRLGRPDQREIARIVVRALATIEMVIKDAEQVAVIRRGNRDDFKAALILIEQCVLPWVFRIIFPEPLFADYTTVAPCIGWEYFEETL